jgi:two-component system response regulator CiaR
LLTRAQAHLQRTREILAAGHVAKAAPLQLGDLSLSLPGRKASYQGQPLELKGREFELLHYLCQHAGRFLSREQIARRLWTSQLAPGSRKVDNLVLRLRKQLPAELQIRSRYGNGYCLDIS